MREHTASGNFRLLFHRTKRSVCNVVVEKPPHPGSSWCHLCDWMSSSSFPSFELFSGNLTSDLRSPHCQSVEGSVVCLPLPLAPPTSGGNGQLCTLLCRLRNCIMKWRPRPNVKMAKTAADVYPLPHSRLPKLSIHSASGSSPDQPVLAASTKIIHAIFYEVQEKKRNTPRN